MKYPLKSIIKQEHITQAGFQLVDKLDFIPTHSSFLVHDHVVVASNIVNTAAAITGARFIIDHFLIDVILEEAERQKNGKCSSQKYLYGVCDPLYAKEEESHVREVFERDQTIVYLSTNMKVRGKGILFHNGGTLWFADKHLHVAMK